MEYTTTTIRNRKTKLNKDLINRIFNFKFRQTLQYAKNEPNPVRELLGALERTLGNIGWIGNKEDIEQWVRWDEVSVADLIIILSHALANIGVPQEALSMVACVVDEDDGIEDSTENQNL